MRGARFMLLLVAACGDDAPIVEAPPEPPPPPPPEGCVAGQLELDGNCLEAGMQPNGCAAGEAPSDDGCVAAGVPPDRCAPGFVGENQGCTPILPAGPCPDRTMAVPGETGCRAVFPCPDARFPDVGGEAAEYVEQSAAPGGDGSMAAPWRTLGEAIDAAEDGAIVAIGAGDYEENVTVAKPLRLWGICPAKAEISGSGGMAAAAIAFVAGSDGSELRTVAVTGDGFGVTVAADDVVLDRVRVHDTGFYGLYVEPLGGIAASATLRGSLIERAGDKGAAVTDGTLAVEASVIRATAPSIAGAEGNGFYARSNVAQTTASISGSLIEGNHERGVRVNGATVAIAGSVVRDTVSNEAGFAGRGVELSIASNTIFAPVLSVTGSVITGNQEYGLYVWGGTVTVEDTVIADTRGRSFDGIAGWGVYARPHQSWPELSVVMRRALIADNTEVGMFITGAPDEAGLQISGADAELEAIAVRGTKPSELDLTLGRGLTIDAATTTELRYCTIDDNRDAGLSLSASDVEIDGCAIRATKPVALTGRFGRGVDIVHYNPAVPEPVVHMRHSVVEHNHELGVAIFGTSTTLEGCAIRDQQAQMSDGGLGRGLTAQLDATTAARARVVLHGCAIERNRDIGVAAGTADLTFELTRVADTLPRAADELFGWGVSIRGESEPGNLVMTDSLVTGSYGLGVNVAGSFARLERTTVLATAAEPHGLPFGDGVVVNSGPGAAQLELIDSRVSDNARAGVAVFGAGLLFEASELSCNALDLTAETILSGAPTIEGSDNRCGCGEPLADCKAVSAGLDVPEL